MAASALVTVAHKELADGLRNRWIWTVSAFLGLSVLTVAFFGAAPVGVAGARGGAAVMASLLNLIVYLVPLLALILGCGAVIDEKNRGTLDLILVSPLSAAEYFAGAFLGFGVALSVALVCGLASSGLVLSLSLDLEILSYLKLTGLALALGVVFLSLSFLLSILSRERGRAVVSSLVLWVASVFVFDLLLVGILIWSEGKVPVELFGKLLLLNPADVFRLLSFHWIEDAAAPLGLSGMMNHVPSPMLLGGVLVAWTVVPLLLSFALFRRRVVHDTLV
ncbi:MAG: ABC transporter permease [Candidatus Binatia bacterium]